MIEFSPISNNTWINDQARNYCHGCDTKFTLTIRKHHCRSCGFIFCDKCTRKREVLSESEIIIDTTDLMVVTKSYIETIFYGNSVRVCDECCTQIRNKKLEENKKMLGKKK
jgi:hypothetical protein